MATTEREVGKASSLVLVERQKEYFEGKSLAGSQEFEWSGWLASSYHFAEGL